MTKFNEWCDETEEKVNGHVLTVLSADEDWHGTGVDLVSKVVPQNYVSNARYAHLLNLLGKPATAKSLQNKMPVGKKGRSGDLGEILAITYVEENTIWDQVVTRLRWSDHREMPMRGDDLIAMGVDSNGVMQILKGEVKSRAKLATKPITDAREALLKDNERPTPHALSFISDRLYEEGRTDISGPVTALCRSFNRVLCAKGE